MAHSKHLFRSGDVTTGYLAWCGYKQFSDYGMTRFEGNPHLCSKCSSRFYAEKTKTFAYRLGDRLNLSDDERRWKYKSIYPIIRVIDDIEIGFVTIANGWGKAWSVHAWAVNIMMSDIERNKEPFGPVMEANSVTYRRKPDDTDEYGSGSFDSKEAALFAVPVMVEQNKLPSRDQVQAEAHEQFVTIRRQFEVQTTRTERLRSDRAEMLRLIQEEFAGLIAAGALTNAQHVALTKAAELIGVKLFSAA